MEKIHIAILIPVFNKLDFTKKCLHDLVSNISSANIEKAKFEIIVIDDGSVDGTSEWISENYNDVIVLKGDGDLWWSGCINVGAKYVLNNKIAEYTLWWNNDISPAEDYFSELVDLVSEESGKGIVLGSKIYNSNNGQVWSMGGIFDTKTGVYYQFGIKRMESSFFERVIDVDWLTGMGTLIPIEAYERIGWLDEKNFPQYHGDLDFTLRCSIDGYQLQVNPNLRIYNDTSNSGFRNKKSWKDILIALRDNRSLYNFKKDIILYRKHTNTPLSYYQIAKKYYRFFGGFIKWKFLSFIGFEKKKG